MIKEVLTWESQLDIFWFWTVRQNNTAHNANCFGPLYRPRDESLTDKNFYSFCRDFE